MQQRAAVTTTLPFQLPLPEALLDASVKARRRRKRPKADWQVPQNVVEHTDSNMDDKRV